MAGNPLLISPELLREEGLLSGDDAPAGADAADPVDYPRAVRWKEKLVARAYDAFTSAGESRRAAEFAAFRQRQAGWLEDYALFRALRDEQQGRPWSDWPEPLRDRHPGALAEARRRLQLEIDRRAFEQYLFERQWDAVRRQAAERGIRIIGDLPIFVAHDSADVWAHREIFDLQEDGSPRVVSGVPPDYFSRTGQLWGNPLYRWDVLERSGFQWWVERFRRTFELVDLVRVDHFRGFEAFWEVPAEAETAVDGRWVPGPGAGFFRAVEARLGALPIIAEDLGLITPAVDALRDELGFPGMRVLQFAFDGDPGNTHLPENHTESAVAYPGTHDNDTIAGWWREADESQRENARRWMDERAPEAWDFIASVFHSQARLAIVPFQDLLGLGSEARMNTPGEPEGNWMWRMPPGALDASLAEKLRTLTRATGRVPASAGPDGDG